jgi:hypothetical protein
LHLQFKSNYGIEINPQTSNNTLPPLTLAPQCDTGPLPLPILTPIAFDVIGKSGNIFIQILPFLLFFLLWLV